METAQHSTATSSNQEPEMGAPKNQSLSSGERGRRLGSLGRAKSRKQRDSKTLQPKRKKNAAVVNGSDGGEPEEDENKAEMEGKIAALQRIVPGGVELGVDKLFEETAGYILNLQGQVKAMRALANFFEVLEKEKWKLGG
ncbi:transcription factor PAR1-like [Rhodamnia argentea]|uniref:Transcription factor PAR1-like n=1 Tax=Rhodamnia argentea TaxID=178133 RepID=A0A8B8N0S6_9MYRT|nr:transcription factor PAR1-like [Rhodamnia argentea]